MNLSIDNILLIGSILLFLSIFASRASYRLGIPILVLFLFIGMLSGSDGLGIQFNDSSMAQFVGMTALNVILFSGGLDTKYSDIRPVAIPGTVLATLGVFLTALFTGVFIFWLTNHFFCVITFTLLESLLLASVMSSTDSASVFGILRSKGVSLKGHMKPLLEFESGSNDPMAYLLTITLIQMIQTQAGNIWYVVGFFLFQFIFGALMGFGLGKLFVWILNKLELHNRSLYPVLLIAVCFFIFALTNDLQGNGYLAVYVGGLVIGNSKFTQKFSSKRFFDGLTWLFQIIIFLCLGLLVNPKELLPVMGVGLIIGFFMILLGRPLSVFICLLPFKKMSIPAKVFTSWVGLRGAVPIIFATYTLTAGIDKSPMIFNIVFFVTLISLLVQGTTIPLIARWLGLAKKPDEKPELSEFEIELSDDINSVMKEFTVDEKLLKNGNRIKEISLHPNTLVVMVKRGEQYLIPTGSTELFPQDILLLISDDDAMLKDI
ncbi:MAG: potassium/proton antiporter [Dysgonamonadaceae bacterium]|jgi:cell volume regulation protein A|nr:potassium/proton antiporter [Dysgonamonadaceae bacterium]